MNERKNTMFKLCLTGGPCGGKSSALSMVKQKLESRGYTVAIVPEAATKIITSGIVPGVNVSGLDFQRIVMLEQIHNEDMFKYALNLINPEKSVLLCDRGIGDQYAYMDKKNMGDILAEHNLTKEEAFSRYDCVIHLKTAADGAIEHYQWNDPNSESNGNNAARSESPEEAIKADKRTLDGWIGHPHLRMVDNSTSFTEKIDRVMKEVFTAMGEPVPKEIERKFLIQKPDKDKISLLGCVSKTHITQTYLKSEVPETERRIRKRGSDINGYSYYYTEKTELSEGVRKEVERLIDAREYATYLEYEADPDMHTIEKDRYCFMFDGRYFEMDLYSFDDDYAILEIELNDINEQIALPDLGIVEEVTNDYRYRNHSLAMNPVIRPDDVLPKVYLSETEEEYDF